MSNGPIHTCAVKFRSTVRAMAAGDINVAVRFTIIGNACAFILLESVRSVFMHARSLCMHAFRPVPLCKYVGAHLFEQI